MITASSAKAFRMQLQQLEQFEVVAEAADGRQAVQLAETESPDVVIMDAALRAGPGRNRGDRSNREAESQDRRCYLQHARG